MTFSKLSLIVWVTIVAIFLSLPALAAQTAERAYDFANRIGVNAQPDYLSTVQQTLNEFAYLGHVWNDRDAIQQNGGEYSDPATGLWIPIVQAGIRLHLEYTVDGNATMTQHMGWLHEIWNAVPGSIVSVAGPNEADGNLGGACSTSFGAAEIKYDGLCGTAAADQIQKDLYAAIKADSTFASAVPVAMWPATINVIYGGNSSVPAIGNMTAYCDEINMHDYFTPDEDNNYGVGSYPTPWATDVSPAVTAWGQICGRAPKFITSEAGIDSSTVGQDVQSKNGLKQILDHVLPPVYGTPAIRYYYFNLTDDASGTWGMFTASGTPKQFATNLRDMLAIVWDSATTASTFTMQPYSYTVANQCADCYSGILGKASGAYDIVLWNETPIFTCPSTSHGVCTVSNGGKQVAIPTTTETVNLPAVAGTVTLYDPIHNGQTAKQTYSNVQSVSVALNDSPLILEIAAPASTPSAPTSPAVGTITQTSVVLTANASSTGTLPITYNSFYQPNRGAVTAGPTATPAAGVNPTVTITGLQAATTYAFWFTATNSAGTSAASTQVTATTASPQAISPPGTAIPSATELVDNNNNIWTVQSGVVYENNSTAGFSSNVVSLLWYQNQIWQENNLDNWWYWNGSTWVASASPLLPPPTIRAYSFLSKIGVNTRTDLTPISQTLSELAYLGYVKNARDSLDWGSGSLTSNLTTLAQNGIDLNIEFPALGTGYTMSSFMSDLHTIWSAVPNSINIVAGPNEVDVHNTCGGFSYSGLCGITAANQAQADLYNAIKGDSTFSANVSVAVWPMAKWSDGSQVGNLTPSCQMINMHDNYDPQEQGANGGIGPTYGDYVHQLPAMLWTSAGYGQICQVTPWETSATGFNTDQVGQDVQSKLILNLVIDHIADVLGSPNGGASAVYLSSLNDNSLGDYGLFTSSGSPKQSATNLRDFLAVLNDSGVNAATFTLSPYSYGVSGNCPSCYAMAVGKSNGAFDIILWNETSIYSNSSTCENTPSTVCQISIPTTTETVNLPTSATIVNLYDPVHNGQAIKQTFSNVSSVTVGLNDSPLILETPPPAPPPVPAPPGVPICVPGST